jgi:hypothetical protein
LDARDAAGPMKQTPTHTRNSDDRHIRPLKT